GRAARSRGLTAVLAGADADPRVEHRLVDLRAADRAVLGVASRVGVALGGRFGQALLFAQQLRELVAGHGDEPVARAALAAPLVPDDAQARPVVVALELGLGDPGGQLVPGVVLHLDDDAGDAGDVTAVLHPVEGAAFGLGEAGGLEEADDRGLGGGAFGFRSAHSRTPWTGWGGQWWVMRTGWVQWGACQRSRQRMRWGVWAPPVRHQARRVRSAGVVAGSVGAGSVRQSGGVTGSGVRAVRVSAPQRGQGCRRTVCADRSARSATRCGGSGLTAGSGGVPLRVLLECRWFRL